MYTIFPPVHESAASNLHQATTVRVGTYQIKTVTERATYTINEPTRKFTKNRFNNNQSHDH